MEPPPNPAPSVILRPDANGNWPMPGPEEWHTIQDEYQPDLARGPITPNPAIGPTPPTPLAQPHASHTPLAPGYPQQAGFPQPGPIHYQPGTPPPPDRAPMSKLIQVGQDPSAIHQLTTARLPTTHKDAQMAPPPHPAHKRRTRPPNRSLDQSAARRPREAQPSISHRHSPAARSHLNAAP